MPAAPRFALTRFHASQTTRLDISYDFALFNGSSQLWLTISKAGRYSLFTLASVGGLSFATTGYSAPVVCFGTLTLTGLPLEFLPYHQTTGSHVPHHSPIQVHAAFMPDATQAVIRFRLCFIPEQRLHPGFDVIPTLSTRHQRFIYIRLLEPYLIPFLRNLFHNAHDHWFPSSRLWRFGACS